MDKLTHDLYERNLEELISAQMKVVKTTQALINILTILNSSANLIPELIQEDIKSEIMEAL